VDERSGITEEGMDSGFDCVDYTAAPSSSPPIVRRNLWEEMFPDYLAKELLRDYGPLTELRLPGQSFPPPPDDSATTSCESPSSAPETSR
jgi:hypothetical protein